MLRMNEDETKILEYLNNMLTSMNHRIKSGNVALEEFQRLRATASAIYRFAEADTKKLPPRDTRKVEQFALIQHFKTQVDSAVKSETLKHKVSSYLLNNPIVKKLSSWASKIHHKLAGKHAKKSKAAHQSPGTFHRPEETGAVGALPSELQLMILHHMDPKTRGKAAQVSTSLYGMANDEQLWKSDIQRTYNLKSDEIAIVKKPEETHKQLFIRLRDSMNTFMLYQSLDTSNPIELFNQDKKELLFARLFRQHKDAQAYMMTQTMRGRPVIAECALPIELVQHKISQRDAAGIAPHIRKVDSREVIYDGKEFKTKSLTRSLKKE